MGCYNLKIDNHVVQWTHERLEHTLVTLGNLSGRKAGWIRSDLMIVKSNWFTRLIWTVVAKFFSWMRKHLYGVDLEQSRSLLREIGYCIDADSILSGLYTKALNKFNEIAPKHYYDPILAKINGNLHWSLNKLGWKTKEEVFKLISLYGEKIEGLNFGDFETLNDEDLREISIKLPSLKILDVSYGSQHLTDDALVHLESMTKLEDLCLSGCTNITGQGLDHLKKIKTLKKLSVFNCDKIKEEDLDYFKKSHVELCSIYTKSLFL